MVRYIARAASLAAVVLVLPVGSAEAQYGYGWGGWGGGGGPPGGSGGARGGGGGGGGGGWRGDGAGERGGRPGRGRRRSRPVQPGHLRGPLDERADRPAVERIPLRGQPAEHRHHDG